MDAEKYLNRVRRAVEDGLVRLAGEPLPPERHGRQAAYVEADVTLPLVVRGHDLSQSDNGVLYQRCGGGRRVIRKRVGA